MYDELLNLCGYTPEEIAEQKPRVEQAFQKLGLTEEDIKRGESRLRQFYAVDLEPVRMLLGVWVKELIDTMMAGEEKRKIIYSEWPGANCVLNMGGITAYEDVHFATPVSQTFMIVLGGIFGKLDPFLEAGEGMGLGPAKAHCGLWQMHVGVIASGIIPKPDLIITSQYICDQAAEADQLLEDMYGIPVVYLDGCCDWQYGEMPSRRQVELVAGRMHMIKDKIEEVCGAPFPDEAVMAGFKDMAKSYFFHKAIADTMIAADPQPISQLNLDLVYFAQFTTLQRRKQFQQAATALAKEVKRLVQEGKGVVPKGAPRVYLAFRFPAQPDVYKMIEEVGLAVPVALLDYLEPDEDPSTYNDLMEIIAKSVYRNAPPCTSYSNIRYNVNSCKEYDLDGAIEFYPLGCRPYSIPPLMIKQQISDELGIPSIVLEWGGYDPRDYPAGQFKSRMETFAETVKMSRNMKKA